MKNSKALSIEDLKNKKVTLFLSSLQRRDFIREIGFDIDEEGYIVDSETGKRVRTREGEEINIFRDKSFGIIGGSIEFFKDIVDYSSILTERGIIKVTPEERKDNNEYKRNSKINRYRSSKIFIKEDFG